MRKNKNLLFGGMGFLGGVAGGLVGEAVRPGGLHSYIESSVGSVAKWFVQAGRLFYPDHQSGYDAMCRDVA